MSKYESACGTELFMFEFRVKQFLTKRYHLIPLQRRTF